MSREHASELTVEVVTQVEPSRRRLLVVGLMVLLLGGVGVWVMLPGDSNDGRSSLAADGLEDTSSVDGPTTATTIPAPIDSEISIIEGDVGSGSGATGMDSTSLASDTGIVPDEPVTTIRADSFSGIYSANSCNQFTYSQSPCLGALNQYCASHTTEPWFMPSLVGRSGSSPFTAQEIDAAMAYGFCALGRIIPLVFNPSNTTCTHEPSQVGLIAYQQPAVGVSLERYPNSYPRLTLYRDCGPTTTCVLYTLPTDPSPDATPPTSMLVCE